MTRTRENEGVLLAIDTSAGTAVAVVDADGAVLAERADPATRRHVELVGVFIRDALREAGVRPSEVDAVASGMGPGPFTGLRVGIAAARAFAIGAGCPVISVVSHDAVAFGSDAPVLVVTDARRREVAVSRYAAPAADGAPVRIEGPALARPDEVETPRGVTRIDAAEIPAGGLGALAALLLRSGAPTAPDVPLYLRAPDVTLSAGPKRVTA